MAKYKRGKKIKRSKKIYKKRKTKAQNMFGWIITLVIIAVVLVVGYSVGKPVTEFLKERKNSKPDTTSGWIPPDSTSSTDNTNTSDTTAPIVVEPNAENYSAYALPLNALLSKEALTTAITSAKEQGYTSIVVTLKAKGGEFYYTTTNELAINASAVVGTMSAKDIAQAITDKGLKPIAEISVLNDHITSRKNETISYMIESSNSIWLDNSPTKGGKAWISPFSDGSKAFINSIVTEFTDAGFTKVISTDIIFPTFRNSDLNYLGEKVKSATRYKALIEIANLINANLKDKNGQMLLEVSANGILDGTSEIFVPAELSGINLIASINLLEIPNKITLKDATVLDLSELSVYDKIKIILTKTKELSGDIVIIPSLSQSGLSETDISEAIRAFIDSGYKTYIVK